MHMVMEKATSNLKHAQIDPRRAAIQLLQTLYRMHHLKIMHRDLKTSNVLVLGDQLWVCDFGLSRQFCNECGEDGSEYVFTSWYRAPEVFRKEGYTEKADMWSLGCLLHKIVHGDVPGTDLDEIVRYVPSLSSTGEMNVLIKNLLRMNPVERWSAETALAFLNNLAYPATIRMPRGHGSEASAERNGSKCSAQRSQTSIGCWLTASCFLTRASKKKACAAPWRWPLCSSKPTHLK